MEKFIKYFLIILFSFNNISAQINDESWKIYNDETIASIKIYATPEVLEYLYSNVESDSLHIATVIYQNYPNPFNPSTEIKFSLQQNSHVKLEIFNILGQKVAKLIDKEMTAGSHNYQLSIDNYQLSSGVYFYQMQTSSGFTDIKKMILMK